MDVGVIAVGIGPVGHHHHIMQFIPLADCRPGIMAFRLTQAVVIRLTADTVFDQNRAECKAEGDVIGIDKLLNRRAVGEAAPGHQDQVALIVHQTGVHLLGTVAPLHFAIIDHNTRIPGFEIVTASGDHRIHLSGHFRGGIKLLGIQISVSHMPDKLGGMGDLHLRNGVDHIIQHLLPAHRKDALVQIIGDFRAGSDLSVGCKEGVLTVQQAGSGIQQPLKLRGFLRGSVAADIRCRNILRSINFISLGHRIGRVPGQGDQPEHIFVKLVHNGIDGYLRYRCGRFLSGNQQQHDQHCQNRHCGKHRQDTNQCGFEAAGGCLFIGRHGYFAPLLQGKIFLIVF